MATPSGLPLSFNLYTGFGEVLEVLDDRDLLTQMANLKQRALSPQRQPAEGTAADGAAAGSGAAALGNSSLKQPVRPQTAPPGGRKKKAAAAAAADGSQDEIPAGEGVVFGAAQQARRGRWEREEKAERKRQAAKLEKRWEEADRVVNERREKAAADAKSRVAAWDGKRQGGKARMNADMAKRLDELAGDLLKKEKRLNDFRDRTAAEVAQKREEHASMRMQAAQRFAVGITERTNRLKEAEERVAQRVGAMAALKRQELDARAERGLVKQLEAMDLRRRQEAAVEAKILATEQKSKKRAEEVEIFLQRQQEQHAAKVEEKRLKAAGLEPGQSPRGQQQASPRGGGESGGGSRPKKSAHEGATGLEIPILRCALCEGQFSELTGVTFLKAVATQRAKFGDDSLLRWCTKRGLQTMYESASLCCFCCQFFAQGWRD